MLNERLRQQLVAARAEVRSIVVHELNCSTWHRLFTVYQLNMRDLSLLHLIYYRVLPPALANNPAEPQSCQIICHWTAHCYQQSYHHSRTRV